MPRRRMLLADERPVQGSRLAAGLSQSPDLRLEGVAVTLMEAYNMTESLAPEAVAISVDMVLRPEFPMFRALLEAMGTRYALYGARLPDGLPPAARRCFVETGEAEAAPLLAWLGAGPGGAERAPAAPPGATRAQPAPLIVLGASTGGIEALEVVLSAFPPTAPPVLIVQHIRGEFSSGVAARLDRAGPVAVREAVDGAPLQPGHAYLAPGNSLHLEVAGRQALRCRLRPGAAVSGHRPSVDVLFHSAAPHGRRVIAALLTGMGRDGAEGLLAIRRAGGMTLAQDGPSCVVHGMPRVACEIGAVDQELPLQRLGPAILSASAEALRGTGEVAAR